MNYVLDMDTVFEENTVTKREQLLHVIQTTPSDSPAHQNALTTLEAEPNIPESIEHIWPWFWDLHKTRSNGMSGPSPITYLEIQAWNNLTNNNIREIEVEFLKIMDRIYLQFIAEKHKKKPRKK